MKKNAAADDNSDDADQSIEIKLNFDNAIDAFGRGTPTPLASLSSSFNNEEEQKRKRKQQQQQQQKCLRSHRWGGRTFYQKTTNRQVRRRVISNSLEHMALMHSQGSGRVYRVDDLDPTELKMAVSRQQYRREDLLCVDALEPNEKCSMGRNENKRILERVWQYGLANLATIPRTPATHANGTVQEARAGDIFLRLVPLHMIMVCRYVEDTHTSPLGSGDLMTWDNHGSRSITTPEGNEYSYRDYVHKTWCAQCMCWKRGALQKFVFVGDTPNSRIQLNYDDDGGIRGSILYRLVMFVYVPTEQHQIDVHYVHYGGGKNGRARAGLSKCDPAYVREHTARVKNNRRLHRDAPSRYYDNHRHDGGKVTLKTDPINKNTEENV